MAIPESTDPKSRLRKHMRRITHGGGHASKSVCQAAFRWLSDHPDLRIVAVFSALPGEPDLTELAASHPDHTWIYPKVNGDHMTFHAVADPERELAPGAFGILEPVDGLIEIAIDRIDAFFCPGVAFDARGGRLGRGRGFYDRLLSQARPDALKIGVCFASQIVPDTFPEPHDIHMDAVVSEEVESE